MPEARFAVLIHAARSLWLHRLRAALSALGIVCGVVSFVAIISLSDGAREETLAQIEQLGLRNVMVRGAALTAEDQQRARFEGSQGLNVADASRVAAQRDRITRVAAVRELTTTVALTARGGAAPMVIAVTPNFIELQRLEVASGRFLADDDVACRNFVCVLGAGVADGWEPRENPAARCASPAPSAASWACSRTSRDARAGMRRCPCAITTTW